MSLTAGIIVTLIVQAGAATWNYFSNKKHTETIKELQRKSKKKSLEEEIERSQERFKLSCRLQLQMEQEAHIERLNEINQSFIDSFEKYTHQYALTTSYPLNISPYVIRNSVIPMSYNRPEHTREGVFCILTNSNDTPFNRNILPLLDQELSAMISEYWNQRSLHTICYYTDMWKNGVLFSEDDIKNLKAILRTPTITITPFIVRNEDFSRLEIKINLWNGSQEGSYSYDTGIAFRHPIVNLSKKEKHKLASDALTHILCSMGFQTDLYYWTTSHQSPLLPYLISQDTIKCDAVTKDIYKQAYTEAFRSQALGLTSCKMERELTVKEHAEITLCNFPERSVDFLRSLTTLTDDEYISSILLSETLLSIVKSRTDISVSSAAEIDTRYLTIDDINIVSELIRIAQKCRRNDIVADFTDVIRKRILQK
ncbi:MAG: hypothetical protein IJB05_03960 [Bacteroidales bacterium]|nr:hypothetical protein [Bacteroidales bacterium]